MNSDSSTENRDNSLELITVEEFLSKNHRLFAVAGVLAGVSVYLKEFQEATADVLVNLGVVSALLMFVVTAGILLYRMLQQAISAEDVEAKRIAPYAALITGLGGLTVSILSVVIEFQTQLIFLLDWSIGIGIFTAYLIWFPTGTFQEAQNVSKSTKNAIEQAPGVAVNIVVLLILFTGHLYADIFVNVFNLNNRVLFQELGYQGPYLIFPMFILASLSHVCVSLVVKQYYVFRD